jgi:hypothetical protein
MTHLLSLEGFRRQLETEVSKYTSEVEDGTEIGTITRGGNATDSDLSPDILNLARRFSRIHGNVRINPENTGVHLYMPCPQCIEDYGKDELFKMHLAVNATKFINTGSTRVCMCMKTGQPFEIQDLLTMVPVTQRGALRESLSVETAFKVTVMSNRDKLEPDSRGNLVPKNPGTVLPLSSLDPSHPARQYLYSRGYDISGLETQFRAAYCTKARDDVYYRRLLHGFVAGPEGRIVFYIDVDGVSCGWQARILDFKDDRFHYFWSESQGKWCAILKKAGDTWEELSPVAGKKWDPAKYVIAPGASRNQSLMGFDAAVTYNRVCGTSILGITEGPLDAARLGMPFCACMGKYFSDGQAKLALRFDTVVVAAQNDSASAKLVERAVHKLDKPGKRVVVITPPPEFNDFGDMLEPGAAVDWLNKELDRQTNGSIRLPY